MRASRLLTILLTLQTRGLVTATELAEQLEVSVRTVYRDVEALGAAGVPVYAERGPAGGYRLLEGFRTRINGLTQDEADALFLAGLPGPAAELGLGAVVASAQLKVQAGLPAELRDRVGRAQLRFHLDAPGWHREADRSPELARIAGAVWTDRRIRVRYRRWAGEVTRDLEPYGLVLKAGAWYLVARTVREGEHRDRTYRVVRIEELDVLDEMFERDPSFDLPAYWRAWSQDFVEQLRPILADVLVTEDARAMVRHLFGAHVADTVEASAGEPLPDGRVRADFPIETIEVAVPELLRLGPQIEILGPPELRARVAAEARATAARYA
ncbi:helix-turn-helix transcriptional regulator [Embleya sp. NPDC050154]|uniref:helix-turn-helix transcriptional regulator n=1 Tax=Embleya sp. NPDC050154 TaxID=3363988 RepID=UPI00379DF1A2